ncbi:MAG: hypothetical protein E4H01_13605 [Lysobacterales bacterium]|nr:MAG: hypothetical protein E4H01_13605 [Xanthomonadales bacterium]
MISTYPILRSYRQNLSVATAFWGACLVLVMAEAALGSNIIIGGLYVLLIPLLVAVLTWVNKGIVFDRAPRTFGSVLILGVSVLAVSTVIILVGMLAAANLKSLMIGV